MKLHTKEELHRLAYYNPDTGIFTCITTNSLKIKPGDVIGTNNGNGYLRTMVDSRRYYLHRLAFLYMLGEMPTYVDHINRDTLDNRWCNLREASNSQNQMNKAASYKNSTGIKGINIVKQGDRYYYHCQVRLDGKQYGKKFRFYEHDKQKVLPLAINWVEQKREELHKEFTRHK